MAKLNRHARRAADKAALCVSRQTRVPAGVRQALQIQPGLLDRLAGRHGMRIGIGGCVTPVAPPAGDGSSPIEPIGSTETAIAVGA